MSVVIDNEGSSKPYRAACYGKEEIDERSEAALRAEALRMGVRGAYRSSPQKLCRELGALYARVASTRLLGLTDDAILHVLPLMEDEELRTMARLGSRRMRALVNSIRRRRYEAALLDYGGLFVLWLLMDIDGGVADDAMLRLKTDADEISVVWNGHSDDVETVSMHDATKPLGDMDRRKLPAYLATRWARVRLHLAPTRFHYGPSSAAPGMNAHRWRLFYRFVVAMIKRQLFAGDAVVATQLQQSMEQMLARYPKDPPLTRVRHSSRYPPEDDARFNAVHAAVRASGLVLAFGGSDAVRDVMSEVMDAEGQALRSLRSLKR